jgi:hypothetical protein
MKKYSITLVFSSWSDSCHVNIRITFSDCSLQLSQIWRRCQNFRFEVILADSRRATCRGVSTTWWRVYCVSVMDPLAWWCQSITWMCSVCLPSIVMLIGILSLLTFESLHITEPLIKSLYKVVLLWPISLPWNSEWKFSTLSRGFLLRWNCGSRLIKSYLFRALVIYRLSESFQGYFPILCILAQVTKTWWLCITTSPCTIPCALWLHHIISINTQVQLSLEQECKYPIPPWVYPW